MRPPPKKNKQIFYILLGGVAWSILGKNLKILQKWLKPKLVLVWLGPCFSSRLNIWLYGPKWTTKFNLHATHQHPLDKLFTQLLGVIVSTIENRLVLFLKNGNLNTHTWPKKAILILTNFPRYFCKTLRYEMFNGHW